VNTAARMESTGAKNRIQLSKATAELIMAASGCKDIWVKPRETLTNVKGKGQLQTYWLEYKSMSTDSVSSSSILTSTLLKSNLDLKANPMNNYSPEDLAVAQSEKVDRLIDWNVDVLQGLLKKILGMRGNEKATLPDENNVQLLLSCGCDRASTTITVLDEVKEIITLPSQAAKYKSNPDNIRLNPIVITQLRQYISTIASMYHEENRFHCFEHASHVTQSVAKLLARVVTPETIDYGDLQYKQKAESSTLHKYTFGITSDPITQFAVAFSALIHDVDHPGVPNAQLVKEESNEAVRYKNKSVAEQNSVDLAWELLMSPEYNDLRQCIFSTQEELDRFRQVVVNAVMATDIVDKELGALRKKRWATAFYYSDGRDSNKLIAMDRLTDVTSSSMEDANRKATIVIEHLIQASDVSHTMQHWHVYLKWNERFFHECYQAFVDGRSDNKDPSECWYQGELGFFDFYVIPLAKKLKECGVFGVASDKYLTYAEANRAEWALKGKDLVQSYLQTFEELQKNCVIVEA
jgi:hypothetical protein